VEADPETIYQIIKPAGFGRRRTRQLRSIVQRLNEDFANVEAKALWEKSDDELIEYLTSLPGVSGKVARCVMMYTLERAVLPVDVHVHRIAKRLGWTSRNRPEQCHEELEALLPSHRYYAFHVDCLSHGRTICTPSNPTCSECPLSRYCAYFGGTLSPNRVG
jgi:endonuclease-3